MISYEFISKGCLQLEKTTLAGRRLLLHVYVEAQQTASLDYFAFGTCLGFELWRRRIVEDLPVL